MTDLRLPRLDDGAAAIIKAQAEARGCTPQAVVERLVSLWLELTESAKFDDPAGDGECARTHLALARLDASRDYWPDMTRSA